MAKENEEVKNLAIIAPDLFTLIDEEEINPPQYSGKDFIGETICIHTFRFEKTRQYGEIVIAEVSTKEDDTVLECALTAWRMKPLFIKLMEMGISLPFTVKIVADGESYKFAPTER